MAGLHGASSRGGAGAGASPVDERRWACHPAGRGTAGDRRGRRSGRWVDRERRPRRPRRVCGRARPLWRRGPSAGAPHDRARVDVLRAHRRAFGPSGGRGDRGDRGGPVSVATARTVPLARVTPRRTGIGTVYRVELVKIASQLLPRLAAAVCLIGPFAFAVFMRTQSSFPGDTLFGRWIHVSGFAIPF